MLILISFLAVFASADSTIQTVEDAPSVYQAILPQASSMESVCSGGTCTISWVNKTGPAVFVDKRAQRKAIIDELKLIAAKADADVTNADLIRAIKLVVLLSK